MTGEVGQKPAIFVDRDGTLCFDRHYLSNPEGLEFIPTVVDGLRLLAQLELPIIIVTNQSGVGRGYFTERALAEIHTRLLSMLSENGVHITDIFHCPHVPGTGCNCRKPAPGMLLMAAEKHGINLSDSFVIGDRMMDIEMAHAAGARGVLVPEVGDQYQVEKEIEASSDMPDHHTSSFLEAAKWVIDEMGRY